MVVKAWEEIVVIPTYEIGEAEKNPMFLENRVYQGSSGVVYPYPVVEKISDVKKDKEWNAVFLENDYLKIMILPGLGGRVQMAFDKTMQRHFIYYNRVIKPALVGLTGPWISGGIEFNWPQHHRPTTFLPVEYYIEKHADGSITVWCSEVERMFRTRGTTGFTLFPGKAYLEIKVRLYNRTNYPQTFLWWANPAVKVNDDYQSVFPPDVHAVFDHGKRDVSEFPVAKGFYYKVDYSPGTDISRYKNIPVPTSYMAVNSKYDFVGGYEHDSGGGLLHIADHHISPGKKQWTWGHSDFGQAWDRNLTDDDGPYIELMCGVYTDNQPDFSWIMPGEEKSFSQYFMPYRDLGLVKNATREAMVNLEFEGNKAIVKAYTTAGYPSGKVIIKSGQKVISEEKFDFQPAASYKKTVELPVGTDPETVEAAVISKDGRVLVSWKPEPAGEKSIPDPASAAGLPVEIKSNDQLYLTGLHLEQYRHATYDPRDYYLEALKRDPDDSRCNNAMGLWLLRRGKFSEAESYFRKAIQTLTERNPNPIDGESFYNLGLALLHQGKSEDAFNAFYKSVWNAAWMDAGYFQLARIAAERQNWKEALDLVDRSLIRNWHNHKARQLKVSILRKAGRFGEASRLIEESFQLDKFNYGVLFEKCLLNPDAAGIFPELKALFQADIQTSVEFALDFAYAGLYDEAVQLVCHGIRDQKEKGQKVFPMALYFKAWMEYKKGDREASAASLKEAAQASPDYCFPNQTEAVPLLEWAMQQNRKDAKAPYYLGNFWYNARQYDDAILNWEKSAAIDGSFPTVHRNLSLAYFNKRNLPERALAELETAFRLDRSDARILMELDQLLKRLNYPPGMRLQQLEKFPELVKSRDDLYLERIVLTNLSGQFEKAFALIMDRKFHPWEGGEGKVTGQYVLSLTEMAKHAFARKEYNKAMNLLQKSKVYPHNLGEGKLYGAQENDIDYWMGCAFEGLNETNNAVNCWNLASEGISEPSQEIFYNDQPPDKIFYQGMALLKLNRIDEAAERFRKLLIHGEKHMGDSIKIDYFAVSLPDLLIWNDNLNRRNVIHCWYLIGLGNLGMGEIQKAKDAFGKVMENDPSHQGAKIHLDFADKPITSVPPSAG